MDKKSKIILILLVITLLSLSSYASLSRFSKGINKEGSINTTELSYCALNEIETLSECLIRNDSKQELSLALNTIDDRTNRVDFSKIEPYDIYIPKTDYINISDKTNTEGIISTTETNFTYVVESKLINPFDINDNETENIIFNEETGYYTYTNSLTGGISDIITTEEDIDNNIYKYTCLNSISNGNCQTLYLFTEEAYLISNEYIFKQGYKYSNELTDTTSMNAGLYKGEDDYTINDSNYTYYYRGDVKNNWVSFGGFLWRIVRINGNGTIRLIYSGLVDAPNHTGNNSHIDKIEYGIKNTYSVSFPRLINTMDIQSLNYTNSYSNLTSVGYMYNPNKVVKAFPDKILGNEVGNNLNYFPTYERLGGSSYYFFKNFNPETDCNPGNGTDNSGTCVLKCNKLGEYGDNDADCIYTKWQSLSENPANYSTTAPGVYAVGSIENYVYQMSPTDGGYRYVCADDYDTLKFPEGDVYLACPTVLEIVGIIKNRPEHAKVKVHGVYAENAELSNMNVLDSNAKTNVETWYKNNILNKKDLKNNYLEDYLADSIFCNDRSSNNYETFPLSSEGRNYTFRAQYRNISLSNPNLKCLKSDDTFNINDAFTLKTSDKQSRVDSSGDGNNMLNYPIGLITVDEVAFAGGKYGKANNKYYLYTGQTYWTMTPAALYVPNLGSRIFFVSTDGNISYTSVGYTTGIRPVINLKSDILYKGGNGTETNPYIIDVNN